MIFLASITIIFSLIFLVISIGRHLTNLLPEGIRASIGFYVAPLLGLAALVLASTVYGWVSPFSINISLPLVIAITAVCVKFEKRPSELVADWLVVSVFTMIASFPVLAPLFRFDSFNPFHDAFTYLAHGQWLQTHAFSEAALPSGNFPAETQIVLYQTAGHRMGASFFLALVQSLFNLEWSYYAYLATGGFVFSLGSLALGGVIQQVTPVPRKVALFLCTVPAFSVNGFIYGVQHGFFPQTFGLSFAAGIAAIFVGLVGYILNEKPTLRVQFLSILPLAVCIAAFLITYNDMLPPIGASMGLFLFIVGWLQRDKALRIVIFGSLLAMQTMAMVNIEGVRILRNFIHTVVGAASGLVHFGWPVLWSPVQFVALTFGLKSPFGDHWLDKVTSKYIFPFVLFLIFAILIRILRKKPKNLMILFLICINVIFWVAFLKFRFASPGPEGEVGNTFLQFKIAKWLSPFNLGVLAIAMAWVYTFLDRYRFLYKYVFLFLFAGGMIYQNNTVAQRFIQQFQDEMMQLRSPFNVLLDLRSRVAQIPKEKVIYLGIPHEHHKITQMVAYVLSDRRLAGKYEDGYLRGSIPEAEREMPLEVADWMIQLKPAATFDENPMDRIGPFLLRRAPFSFYVLDSIAGAYATEVGENKTWNWVKDVIEYRFHLVGKAQKTKLAFQYLLAGDPRVLHVEIKDSGGNLLTFFNLPIKGGWGEFKSPALEINSDSVVIRISADGVPVRLSSHDPRETKFMIQNLSFEKF